MNGGLRVLRSEVRRLLPLVAAMGVVTATLVWTHPSDWGTRWNSLGSTLRGDVIVIGPSCVVVGVWCGGRVRRSAMGELMRSTRRSALGRVSVDLVALVVVLYLGVLLGWASAAWTIVVVGGYGTWVAVWFVLGLLPVVAAYTAVGYAVGRLVSWRVAAPVAGLATYMFFGFGVYSDGRLEQAYGAGYLGGVDGYTLMADVLVWSSLGLLLLALVATAVSGAERRPAGARRWIVIAVLTAGVAVLPFTFIAAQPSNRQPRVVADSPVVCSKDEGPRVCVLAEQQHTLPTATRQARVVIDRFDGVAGGPTRAEMSGGRLLEPTTVPLEATGITPWGRPGGVNYNSQLTNPGGYLDPAYYCAAARPDDLGNPLETAAWAAGHDIAGYWVAGESLPPVDSTRPAVERRFVAATEAQRLRFVVRLARAAQACDVDALRAAPDSLPPS